MQSYQFPKLLPKMSLACLGVKGDHQFELNGRSELFSPILAHL
jgi:hypothetical protein